MHTYIALFRAINVGGKNTLPMKSLTTLLEHIGATEIHTYIQSGNAVFRHAGDAVPVAARLVAAIGEQYGFEPQVLLLSRKDILRACERNPFPEAEAEPTSLHLGFLAATPPAPDLQKLASLKKDNERFLLDGNVFYLHAPDGVGRSKLAAGSERLLGVPMTDRNWRTVCKLRELAGP
ncbi:DUF1697 domain-containing protein [Zoogloea sp. LCSB751]|uniref:DUF1697 domain-containing protein n=1 Tax=Zoogloea sp. LCSB751 TaxID=1965277 RepID=UPI0009A47292|nr:DUF1697 domain-containing protein [Zoogloea sp. LCSB751]